MAKRNPAVEKKLVGLADLVITAAARKTMNSWLCSRNTAKFVCRAFYLGNRLPQSR